jgi:hypothetical protein
MQPIGPSPASREIPRGFVPAATADAAPTAGHLRWDPSRLTTAPSTTAEASAAEHDDTLLVAALEEIERKQQALETLLDADLFKYCLGSQ